MNGNGSCKQRAIIPAKERHTVLDTGPESRPARISAWRLAYYDTDWRNQRSSRTIAAATVADAKRQPAADLAAQRRLLLLRSTGETTPAPRLQENFLMLSDLLEPRA